jgi:hypothetical protein
MQMWNCYGNNLFTITIPHLCVPPSRIYLDVVVKQSGAIKLLDAFCGQTTL